MSENDNQRQGHPLYDGGGMTPYQQQQQRQERQRDYQQARQNSPLTTVQQSTLTYILIAVNVAIYAVGFIFQDVQLWLLNNGAAFPPAIDQNFELHRLFTAMFLHSPSTIAHIAFNMYALFVLGRDVELLFGHTRFAIIYFLGGLAGSILSVTFGDYGVPSVGASGAIFAIFAAQGVFVYRNRQVYGNRARAILTNIALLLGLNLFLGFSIPNIDNLGHIGGLIGGALLAWFIGPVLRVSRGLSLEGAHAIVRETNPLNAQSWRIVGLYSLAWGVLLLVWLL